MRTVQHAGVVWEVDEFLGANAGLVIAEIELKDERQAFQPPSWLSTEVTHDPRYFNSNLTAVSLFDVAPRIIMEHRTAGLCPL